MQIHFLLESNNNLVFKVFKRLLFSLGINNDTILFIPVILSTILIWQFLITVSLHVRVRNCHMNELIVRESTMHKVISQQ